MREAKVVGGKRRAKNGLAGIRRRCIVDGKILSIGDVAYAVGVGYAAAQNWEIFGSFMPNHTNLCRLSDLYGVSVQEIVQAINTRAC